jgi:hypothetical protein
MDGAVVELLKSPMLKDSVHGGWDPMMMLMSMFMGQKSCRGSGLAWVGCLAGLD